MRTYHDLLSLPTLEERFEYLQLGGVLGETTFGSDRWINQRFYHSREWRDLRDAVIARDYGMDLGVYDFPIRGNPIIHHMNPITLEDIDQVSDNLLHPDYMISTSLRTHNAIHYGDRSLLPQVWVPRRPGDTKLW